MNKKDWVYKNWSFIKKGVIKEISVKNPNYIMTKSDASVKGVFYGTPHFYEQINSAFRSHGFDGKLRLYLRPYVISQMPEEGIQAIYIDSSSYKFNEDGIIIKDKYSFKPTVFVFK